MPGENDHADHEDQAWPRAYERQDLGGGPHPGRTRRTGRLGREHGTSAEQDAGHAVAALYRLHYPALVRLAALLIPDLATAEDIVQDAFAAVHGRWHVQPDTDAALAYLRWSVVHRSRSVPPLGGPAAGTGEPGSAVMGEPGSAVMSALRALSARQREVVILRYFADLPEAEIAAATGMSMAAVRDHADQAMSSLQAALG